MSSSLIPERSEVEDVTLKYKEILKRNGITEEISEVLVKDAGLAGEGFASQSLYITVKFENPQVPQMNLFGKAHTNNSTHSEMLVELKAFEKEARFFMEYIPAAEKLCKEKGQLELLDIYPKGYHGDDKLILLENLVLEKGYGLQSKDENQNLEEAKTALLTLAKHHAISHAMIQNHGGAEGFIKAFPNFDFDPFTKPAVKGMFEPMILNSVNNNTKILQKYNEEGRDVALEILERDGKQAFELTVKALEHNKDEDNLLLLNHGDYHGFNMMFLKDPESQKILSHKAIDFQLVRLNSPGVDLGYFLYSSVKPELRRGHLKELLNFYLDNFNKVCSDLGHPIEYSYEDLFLQYRKRFKHGFWFGFIMVGPPPSILKDINMEEIGGDMSKFGVLIDKAIQKWIEEDPSNGEKVGKDVVTVINEYNELSLDD